MKSTTTKKDFREWLESKSPKTIVGESGLIESCPLAGYFLSVNELNKGQVEIEFDITFFNVDGSIKKETPLKHWMNEFVSGIDKYRQEDEMKPVKISAKKALKILDSI